MRFALVSYFSFAVGSPSLDSRISKAATDGLATSGSGNLLSGQVPRPELAESDVEVERLEKLKDLVGRLGLDSSKMLANIKQVDQITASHAENPWIHTLREATGWDLTKSTPAELKEFLMDHIPQHVLQEVGMRWGKAISKVVMDEFVDLETIGILKYLGMQPEHANDPQDEGDTVERVAQDEGEFVDQVQFDASEPPTDSSVPRTQGEHIAHAIKKYTPHLFRGKKVDSWCLNGKLTFGEVIGCMTGYWVTYIVWTVSFLLLEVPFKEAYVPMEMAYASVLSFVQIMHGGLLGDHGDKLLSGVEDWMKWGNYMAVQFNKENIETIEFIRKAGQETAVETAMSMAIQAMKIMNTPSMTRKAMPMGVQIGQAQEDHGEAIDPKLLEAARLIGEKTAQHLCTTILLPFMDPLTAGWVQMRKMHAEKEPASELQEVSLVTTSLNPDEFHTQKFPDDSDVRPLPNDPIGRAADSKEIGADGRVREKEDVSGLPVLTVRAETDLDFAPGEGIEKV